MGFDTHTPAGKDLVSVATHLSGPQAATLQALLRSQGIEAVSSHDWVTGSYLGNVTLRVAAADEERARHLLRVQEAKQASIRKFHPHEEVCLACGAALEEDAESCAICGWSYASGEDAESGSEP